MIRKSDSIPDKDVIIEDPILEPYFIVKSQTGGYAIYERVTTVSKKGANKGAPSEYLRNICYPSTFKSALETVVKEQVHNQSGKTKFNSIKEYLEEFDRIATKVSAAMKYNI